MITYRNNGSVKEVPSVKIKNGNGDWIEVYSKEKGIIDKELLLKSLYIDLNNTILCDSVIDTINMGNLVIHYG